MRGEVRPVQALETPPLVVNIVRQCTDEEPMRGVVRGVEAVIGRAGLLSASVAEGYPYADVPAMGMSFLAVADGNREAARDAAIGLARRAWERRAEMTGAIASPEAVAACAGAGVGATVRLRVGNTSREQMYALGIRPETKRVVVAKGVVSPRPAYAPIAAEIILVDTPGVTTADLTRFRYERRRRPLYPFEPDAVYPGGGTTR